MPLTGDKHTSVIGRTGFAILAIGIAFFIICGPPPRTHPKRAPIMDERGRVISSFLCEYTFEPCSCEAAPGRRLAKM